MAERPTFMLPRSKRFYMWKSSLSPLSSVDDAGHHCFPLSSAQRLPSRSLPGNIRQTAGSDCQHCARREELQCRGRRSTSQETHRVEGINTVQRLSAPSASEPRPYLFDLVTHISRPHAVGFVPGTENFIPTTGEMSIARSHPSIVRYGRTNAQGTLKRKVAAAYGKGNRGVGICTISPGFRRRPAN
ncbi:hypothetical protein Bbelb_314760 [Branchiostoma belcheri]|nr:hypothetical protein Bbelb_314760 [Branchiostoma belcheri]